MSALIDKNPDYRSVKIIRVDWDRFGRTRITKDLKVPRRSTLIAFKGGKERRRVIASIAVRELDALFTAVL